MRPDGFQRLLTTSRTTDGYAHVISPTQAKYTSVQAMIDAGLAVLELGQMRGIVAKLIGKGSADNAVINCRVYLAYYNRGRNSAVPASAGTMIADIDLAYAGLLVGTLSNTRVGSSGSSVQGPTEACADGMTWAISTDATTPKGPVTLLVAEHGGINTPAVFNPADDITDAIFMMADCFDADAVVFDLDRHTNATESNVLAMRTR